MKADKYFLGALGAASTTGAVVGIGAGIVGLIGGGPLAGIVFGLACGVGASAAVLGAAVVLFPVAKLCGYIDEKTNFFTKAGEIISTPFEKFGNWIRGKFTSNTIEPSANPAQGDQLNVEEMLGSAPPFEVDTSPSAPPKPRLSMNESLGRESPPPSYGEAIRHKQTINQLN